MSGLQAYQERMASNMAMYDLIDRLENDGADRNDLDILRGFVARHEAIDNTIIKQATQDAMDCVDDAIANIEEITNSISTDSLDNAYYKLEKMQREIP